MGKRKYRCDDRFFDSIDTEQKAYWLGFLAADGNIDGNRVQLCLSTRDRDHIASFASHVRADAPIFDRSYDGYADRSTLSLTSPRMVAALASHGVVARKSLILGWPTSVPSDLLRHYLRGYMDGDGGFYVCRRVKSPHEPPYLSFSVAGTEALCSAARAFLVANAGASKAKVVAVATSRLWTLGYSHTIAGRVYDLLYLDATVYLPRKKVKKPEPRHVVVDAHLLKRAREASGLTQEGVCERSGLSFQTVWRLESGWVRKDRPGSPQRGVRPSTLHKIALALKVEPSELVKAS